MRVAVIGAEPGVGLTTVQEALSRGHHVRALVRNVGRTAKIRDAVYVAGDTRDASALQTCIAGQDAVIVCIEAMPAVRPVRLYSQSIAALVTAAKDTGVGRVLYVTGIGAGDSRGHGGFFYDRVQLPLLFGRTYADIDRSEALLAVSGLQWTIVRPGFLTRGMRTGQYRILLNLSHIRCGKISRSDVAHFLVDEAERSEFVGETALVCY